MNFVLFFAVFGIPQTDSTLEKIEREIAAVLEKTRPSVVQIAARLGDDESQSRLSSGFVVSSDGHILTDVGGIQAARAIFVTLHDGRRFVASLKAVDRSTAVALLKVNSEGLQAVEFAEPASIRQGAIAVLVSNPAGLNQSCSVGFVTGLDRTIVVAGILYSDMLQTSAAVQSGDGGGLLANARGAVVGMIHSRFVPDVVEPDRAGFLRAVPRTGAEFLPAGGPAVGFATPATTLRFVTDRLIKSGKVQRGWVGLGLRRTAQATQVVEIAQNGPAWKAGIRPGDAVIEFDGQAATDLPALRRRVIEMSASKTVRVRVQRGTGVTDFDVTIAWEPEP